MIRFLITLILLAASAIPAVALNPHPRIFMNATQLNALRTRALAGSTQWVSVRNAAQNFHGNGCLNYPSGTCSGGTGRIFENGPDSIALVTLILNGDSNLSIGHLSSTEGDCMSNVCTSLGLTLTGTQIGTDAVNALVGGIKFVGDASCPSSSYLNCSDTAPLFGVNPQAAADAWDGEISRMHDWLYNYSGYGGTNITLVVGQLLHIAVCYEFHAFPAAQGMRSDNLNTWDSGSGGAGAPVYNVPAVFSTAILYMGVATFGDNPTDTATSNQEIDYTLGYWTDGATYPNPPGTPTTQGVAWLFNTMGHGPMSNEQSSGYTMAFTGKYPESTLLCQMAACATDLYSLIPAGQFDQNIDWMLHYVTPYPSSTSGVGTHYDVWHYGSGGAAGGNDSIPYEAARRVSVQIMALTNDATRKAYMRYFLDNIVPSYTTSGDEIWDMLFVFTGQSGWTATDYKTASLFDFVSGGTWAYSFRSSPTRAFPWTTGDTAVLFLSGHNEMSHGHAESPTFSLYRKGQYLIDHLNGADGSSLNWNISGTTHNLMSFQSASDTVFCVPEAGRDNKQSLSPVSQTSIPHPVAYELNNAYFGYSRQDVTADYQYQANCAGKCTNNVTSYVREFVFLKPDYLVIFDKAAFTNAVQARWSFNTIASTSGNNAQMTAGPYTLGTVSQTLVTNVLLPTSGNQDAATITAWTGVSNVVIACTNTTATAGTCATMNPGCADRNQVVFQSKTGSNSTTQQWLVGIQAKDTSASTSTMAAIGSGSVTGAHIQDATANWVAVFDNASPTANFTLPVSYTYSPTVTTRYHVVNDLPVSTSVCVTGTTTITVQACGSGTPMTVSANGVLAFSEISGTLAQLNAPPAPGTPAGGVSSSVITGVIRQ